MRKKIVILAMFIVFLCSGCTVDYTIDISDEDNVIETIAASTPTSSMSNADFNSTYSYFEDLPSLTEYFSTLETIGSKKVGTFETIYGDIFQCTENSEIPGEYNSSLNATVEDNVVTVTGNLDISIEEYSRFYLPTYDKLTVNIITNREVIEHNADIVKNGKYTWNLYEGQTEKEILLQYKTVVTNPSNDVDNGETSDSTEDVSEEEAKTNKILSNIMTAVAFVILGIGIIFLIKKAEE